MNIYTRKCIRCGKEFQPPESVEAKLQKLGKFARVCMECVLAAIEQISDDALMHMTDEEIEEELRAEGIDVDALRSESTRCLRRPWCAVTDPKQQYECLHLGKCPRCGKSDRWMWRIVGTVEIQCGKCLTQIVVLNATKRKAATEVDDAEGDLVDEGYWDRLEERLAASPIPADDGGEDPTLH